MASHLSVSLSDSVQTFQPWGQRRHGDDPTGPKATQDDARNRDGEHTKGPSLWVQCLLATVFAGMEMSATFTFIYGILFLQFVGVPTSLVSVGGMVGGGSTLVLLPVLGWFSDRGPNPVAHRVRITLVCFCLFGAGYIILALVSASKLYSFQHEDHPNTTTNDQHIANFSYVNNVTTGSDAILSSQAADNHTSSYSTSNSRSEVNTNPDAIGIISIFSFVLLDIGYDSSVCLCRSFVLQCCPQNYHPNLLVLSTVFGSLSGAIFSLTGILNFPELLGPMFDVDGTAATVLLFSCFILTFTSLCFTCTLITGYRLARKNKEIYQNAAPIDFDSNSNIRQRFTPELRTERLGKDESAQCLLANDRVTNKSYDTFSLFFTHESTEIARDEKDVSFSQSDSSTHISKQPETQCPNSDLHFQSTLSCVGSDSKDNEERMDVDGSRDKGLSYLLIASLDSYSMSMSAMQSSLFSEFQKSSAQNQHDLLLTESLTKPKPIWRNKRLMILALSLFFTMGTTVLISAYSSNTLTIGVYHAQPTAPPGTEGRDNYNKGLSNSSLGFFFLYFSYMVFSILNKKLTEIAGDKAMFYGCHILIIGVLLAYTLVQTEALYFASSVVAGMYRACAFTTGFILAHKFATEENAKSGSGSNGGDGHVSKTVGQVMVLLGFLVPGQYSLMSIFMGPLISATGNVWVTIIYGIVCACLAVLIFSVVWIGK